MLNRNIAATFDSSCEYTIHLNGGAPIRGARVRAVRTMGESEHVFALVLAVPSRANTDAELIVNWDNVLYVREEQ